MECNLKTLDWRGEDMCTNPIKSLLDPDHKLHNLLPHKVFEIRNTETRLTGENFFNFNCWTKRFKNSSIVYGIEQYNKL